MEEDRKKLGVGIIGCGRVAGHHALAVKEDPNLRLVAASDLKADRLEEFCKAHAVPGYANYHEMFQKHPDIELVGIVTPSGMHFEHALDAVSIHRKHVVVEKPLVLRVEHGRQLERAAQAAGVQIFPVFQYRFNKCIQRVRRAVEDGELGRIFLATVRQRWCRNQGYYDRDAWRGTFPLDGGACTNQGIHHLDLLRYLAGEVRRVSVKMSTFGSNIEVEDTVVANLEFESGALGVFEVTTAARPIDFESSVSIVGDRGLAMFGGWATDKLVKFSPDPGEEARSSENYDSAYGFGHRQIYAGAVAAIRGSGPAVVTYEDGMKTIQLLQAMYRSDEARGWVDVNVAEESIRLGVSNETLQNQYRTSRPEE